MASADSRASASIPTALDAARQELIDDTIRGAAGRAAVERYADRVDTLVQHLFFEAAPPQSPVAIIALGGYGRRHLLPPLRRRPARPLRRPDRPGGRAISSAASCTRSGICGSCVGHQVRELADFARLETDNPEFLLALLDARPVVGDRGALRSLRRGVPPARRARAPSSSRCEHLIDERHAQFNDTLYQLEPDVKDAPGALRDLLALRDDRAAHRSGAARPRPRRAGAPRRGRGLPAARPIDPAPRAQAQPERAQPRAAGEGGAGARLPGRAARSSASSG